MKYASSVWGPYRIGWRDQGILGCSKNFPHICRKTWDQSYQSLLELFQIPTLEDRRIYLNLCSMFKIVHNLYYFPSDVLCEHNATRTTRATLGRPSHSHFHYPSFHITQFQKSTFTIQAFIPPNFKNLLSYCPWCPRLSFMYGII